MPRLELLSCYILLTLMETIASALNDDIIIDKKQFWTDSTINFNRIRGINKEYKPFVENRLSFIRARSDISDWFYIPTDKNPADLPSRGCLSHELVGNDFWIHGPEFLRNKIDETIFERNIHIQHSEDDYPELKKNGSKILEILC